VLDKINGVDFVPDPEHIHAMNQLWTGGHYADRYEYDANGNMTARNKDLGSAQQMKWDSRNRLAQLTGGGVSEGYRYDEGGQRIRKTNLLTQAYTDYPFANYERTSGGLVTKHYSFGGVAVAVRSGGGSPVFLYQDGVHSSVYARAVRATACAGATTALGSWCRSSRRDKTG
jgi:YD repeat-containing protein